MTDHGSDLQSLVTKYMYLKTRSFLKKRSGYRDKATNDTVEEEALRYIELATIYQILKHTINDYITLIWNMLHLQIWMDKALF